MLVLVVMLVVVVVLVLVLVVVVMVMVMVVGEGQYLGLCGSKEAVNQIGSAAVLEKCALTS